MTTQELTNIKYRFLTHLDSKTLGTLWWETLCSTGHHDMETGKDYFFDDVNDLHNAIDRELRNRDRERKAEIKRREKERLNNRRAKKAA